MDLGAIKCQYCQKKMAWIPIEESMPINKGKYIVTTKKGMVIDLSFVKDCDFWRNNVIAWMPFPEAYDG